MRYLQTGGHSRVGIMIPIKKASLEPIITFKFSFELESQHECSFELGVL